MREDAQGTMLAVQQGTVAVFADNHAASARQVIHPGEQVLFDRSGERYVVLQADGSLDESQTLKLRD